MENLFEVHYFCLAIILVLVFLVVFFVDFSKYVCDCDEKNKQNDLFDGYGPSPIEDYK